MWYFFPLPGPVENVTSSLLWFVFYLKNNWETQDKMKDRSPTSKSLAFQRNKFHFIFKCLWGLCLECTWILLFRGIILLPWNCVYKIIVCPRFFVKVLLAFWRISLTLAGTFPYEKFNQHFIIAVIFQFKPVQKDSRCPPKRKGKKRPESPHFPIIESSHIWKNLFYRF